ncbi:hypothetical protein G9A89_010609 [Geosiphon pyriformis]|nr:hypothetical protein G9A89_010609 [Geosiphon pyriformis]
MPNIKDTSSLVTEKQVKKFLEQEVINDESSRNKIDFNSIKHLETLYLYSTPLKLPSSCNEFISSASDPIPYLRYIKTLHKNGIIIITLGYDDDDGLTLQKIVDFIGIPHKHDNKGTAMWDIKSLEKNNEKHVARSHQLSEFTLHTDCCYEENVPDYFGLYVVQDDQMNGGKNLVIESIALLQHLSKKSFDILQNHQVKVLVPGEFKKEKEFINTFILDKELGIRYRREIIDSTSLTTEQEEAIDELERLIYSPLFSRSLTLNRRQILLLDNKRYLHARTAIKDKNRHLKRIRFFSNEIRMTIT